MEIEEPTHFLTTWLLFLFVYGFLSHFLQEFPVNFDLNDGFHLVENSDLIIEGSQSSYLTKVNKNLKTVNDYEEDFILLCCHILRTRTHHNIQDLLKQILCTMKTRNITSRSIEIDKELYCDIKLQYSSTPTRGKEDILKTLIQFRLFSCTLSKEEILHHMRLIREHYTGIIGNARPECVAEMYTHLYNEPCLVDDDQLNRINKTPKEILSCYHRYPDNPEGFIRSLLRNK